MCIENAEYFMLAAKGQLGQPLNVDDIIDKQFLYVLSDYTQWTYCTDGHMIYSEVRTSKSK